MARRSSTSASEAVLLLAIVLAPLVAAEFWLVPRYSGRAREVQSLAEEEARTADKKFLMLGDSTARRLQYRPPDEVTPVPRKADGWLNYGLGGSSVADWALLCERAYRQKSGIKGVAVMANAGGYGNPVSIDTAPYVAYLSGLSDAIRSYREGEIGAAEAIRLLARQKLHVYSDRNDLLFTLLSFDSDLRPWADRLNFRTMMMKANAPLFLQRVSERSYAWFQRLAVCSKQSGRKFVLVLSPLLSSERATPLHAIRLRAYEDACREGAFVCLNLETAYPDNDFVEDRVHLRAGFENAILEQVEKAMPQD